MSVVPGLGGRVGWGRSPALLVIDMCLGFTDPASPMACDADPVVEAIQPILAAARAAAIPIVFTTVSWGDYEKRAAALRFLKMPAGTVCEEGTRWVEIDPRLEPLPGELVVRKVFASAFFGSTLSTLLRTEEVDTVIVTGVSTSGCVRATVTDSAQHGFHTIVPREAVGDRLARAHEANLEDIDLKYADVIPVDDVVTALQSSAVQIDPSGVPG
jgi:nicotinamidase-related amidase